MKNHFPKDFIWGAATASFQIEGAAEADGKGPSVWDMFCSQPGRVFDGHDGRTACDHYHCYPKDVSLMHEIGLKHYRLSVAWPRIFPEGTGAINTRGLEFYDRLIDTLLAAGVQPWVTLFHWDFPYELYCRGGWLNADSPEWFADYAKVVVDRLSDRVSNWMTVNEPQCYIGLGLQKGVQAPGDRLGLKEVLRAGHHALLAHGRAVQVIRAQAKTKPLVGWAPIGIGAIPENENRPEDVEAARFAAFATGPKSPIYLSDTSVWSNSWWGDPVVFGRYPEDGWEAFGAAVPRIRAGDMETISEPIDFYGANMYTGFMVRGLPDGTAQRVTLSPGCPRTALKWSALPSALYWTPKFLYERYKLPVMVTENGLSSMDWVSLDGKVHDLQRIDFLQRYLLQLNRALGEGVKISGYFQWSLMDNFEWSEGYKERFGLIHVDYLTQKRTLKDSALWYANVMASGGDSLMPAS